MNWKPSHAILGLLFALHFLLAFYFFPFPETFTNAPIRIADHAVHFYDASVVSELLRVEQKAWGYDPNFMSGYPVGTVFDVDNKLTEVFVWAFAFLGKPLAYNLFLLLIFLSLPFVVWFTARNFGLSESAQVWAVALGMVLWHTDPSARTMFYVGMFAFAGVAFFAPFVVSLFYVYVREGGRGRWLGLTLAAILLLWLHALAAIVLVVPLFVLYVFYFRQMSWQRHLSLYAIILLILGVHSYWLLTLFDFQNILTQTGHYFLGGLEVLWADMTGDGLTEGTPFARVLMLRWFVGLLSAGGIYLWRRAAKREFAFTFGLTIVSLFALAYFARYVPGGEAIEPYRFIVPTLFFALVPAAHALADIFSRQTIQAIPVNHRWVWGVLALASLLTLVSAIQQTRPRLERYWTNVPGEDRYVGPGRRQLALFDWLRANTSSDSRILIQDWATGALIPSFVGREVIGGPYYPYFIKHGFVNASSDTAFDHKISEFDPDDLLEYLESYNVQWIVVNPTAFPNPRSYSFETYVARRHPPFLKLAVQVRDYTIYRVTMEPNFFLAGSGRVRASLNRLSVQDASPGTVVLKYHWDKHFKTNPPLPIEIQPVVDDPIGFIKVINGDVRDFEIYNGY